MIYSLLNTFIMKGNGMVKHSTMHDKTQNKLTNFTRAMVIKTKDTYYAYYLILCGIVEMSLEVNMSLFKSVQTYIKDTGRFSGNQ